MSLTALPRAGTAAGAVPATSATIALDGKAPLKTNLVAHTIDDDPPASGIYGLASESPPSFEVSWFGDDAAGCGVKAYDVFVAADGMRFSPWLSGTGRDRALFTGEPGRGYEFCVTAVGWVGNREPAPSVPQAATRVPRGYTQFLPFMAVP